MQRLVTGKTVRKVKGFTLIEVLVVIIIMMVVTTIAMLAFNSLKQGRDVKLVSEMLKKSISAAEQEAILRPAIIKLKVTSTGYEFLQLNNNKDKRKQSEWVALTHDHLSQKNAFRKGIKVSSVTTKKNWIFSPSGDVSPFQLMIMGKEESKKYRLIVQENGVIELDEM